MDVSLLKKAVARVGLVDTQGSARGHKVRDDVRRGRPGLVASEVGVLTNVHVPLAGVANDRLAVGIVGFVEGHGSGHDRDEDWPGVTVPPALTSGLEGDRLSGDVKSGSGLDFHLPGWSSPPSALRLSRQTATGRVLHSSLFAVDFEGSECGPADQRRL